MQILGNLLKLRSVLYEKKVRYYLPLSNNEIFLNDHIGKKIELRFHRQINCIRCGRITSKSFAQGFCFPCFTSAPETEECVLRPELCRAHEGIARDMEYAREHCLIEHFVYLSFTGILKVGVTRYTQIPTRWIDQGATAAIKIACTPNRYTAGLIEVALKKNYADKTNWRNMLKDIPVGINLLKEKEKAIAFLPAPLNNYTLTGQEIVEINYPVSFFPPKVISTDFDKTPAISGILTGIKGQYLIFENGVVINIRKYAGYLIEFIA
jgi:hypothetical protein